MWWLHDQQVPNSGVITNHVVPEISDGPTPVKPSAVSLYNPLSPTANGRSAFEGFANTPKEALNLLSKVGPAALAMLKTAGVRVGPTYDNPATVGLY